MLAIFGIGFFELLILAAVFGVFVIGAIIAVVVVVAAAGNSRRDQNR